MKSTWGEEYAEFGPYLEKFQNEVCEYVETLAKDSADTIHIANVYCRKSGIKTRESIMANQQAGKYDDMHSLLELRDVAGVRVTCHCEDDLINFSALLKGRLMQEYVFVDETKNALAQRTKDEPYRATHLVVGKETKKEGKVVMLYCEIQLRTVMGDAWAVQDHRYIYKRADKDGEDRELTMAVSEIME